MFTFFEESRRRHRDGTAASCGKPRKRDRQNRPGTRSTTQYKSICDRRRPASISRRASSAAAAAGRQQRRARPLAEDICGTVPVRAPNHCVRVRYARSSTKLRVQYSYEYGTVVLVRLLCTVRKCGTGTVPYRTVARRSSAPNG